MQKKLLLLALFFSVTSYAQNNNPFSPYILGPKSQQLGEFGEFATKQKPYLLWHDTIGVKRNSLDDTATFFRLSASISLGVIFDSCFFLGVFNAYIEDTGNLVLGFSGTIPPVISVQNPTSNLNQITISCTDITTKSKCQLYLYDYNIAKKLDIDYRYFELSFITANANEIEPFYEALLNNFRNKGELENYKLLDIDYQRFKLKNSKLGYYFWWVPEYWYNYGYNKERVFGWSLLFLLIFTLLNYWLLPKLNSNVYNIANIPLFRKLSIGKRFWYSFLYTSIIFFKLSLKIENLNTKKVAGIMYLVFIYTLGIICLAYMASFVLGK